MQRVELDRIIREVGEYYEQDSTKLAPAEGFHAASSYANGDWAAKERRMLRRVPIIVGHSSKLKEPGSFFTDDTTGVPLIVVRQNDGSLRALVNVCRHRGARVCAEAEGTRRVFVCPYHAWSFRSDGSLLKIPRPEAFPNLDAKDYGLTEVPVEERHGFIWVLPTPGATIDVAAHLGALDAEIASYGASEMVLEREAILTENMNWKFVIDGFLEVYHFASLHAKSISPYFHGRYSPYDAYGRNGRLIGVRRSFDAVRESGTDGIETAELTKNFAFNYVIFPNTVLVWQADHFECWTSFPGETPDKCVVRVQSITPKSMAGPQFTSRWDKNWKILIGTVVSEDWAVSKSIQQSIHAATNDTIVFGRNEIGLQHFHGEIRKEVERATN
jgi:phenylpropionate dioxygenase-like ring-hydroxylating dioxygenase large terminal subunit